MTRLRFPFALLLAIAICCPICLVGCQSPGEKTHGSASRVPGETPLGEELSFPGGLLSQGDSTQVIGLAFDVVSISFPQDQLRHVRKIWNHIDELRVDPVAGAMCARNGLRVGLGTPEAWPAIRAIVSMAGATVLREPLFAQRGQPLSIELGVIGEPESMFYYGSDGRLTGKTFPAGSKIINLDYAYHPELGGSTDLGVGFEIRRDLGELTFETHEGVLRQVPSFDRHIFSSVAIALSLNSKEFLVLGLGDDASNEYLIGPRFLSRKESGKRYETLLCLTPRAYESRAGRSK